MLYIVVKYNNYFCLYIYIFGKERVVCDFIFKIKILIEDGL